MKEFICRRAGVLIAGPIIVLCVILYTAYNAHADGEIILYPGDKYAIPCLAQLLPGQEYEIEIENPDIVGLDETGKSIVAVAAGTTEVTVRLVNPDAGYLYVFAVADVNAQPAAEIYYDPGKDYVYEFYTDETAADEWDPGNNSEPHEDDEVSPSNQGNGTGRPSDPSNSADRSGTSSQNLGIDTKDGENAGTESGSGVDTGRDADSDSEQRSGVDTGRDTDSGTEPGSGVDTGRNVNADTEHVAGSDAESDEHDDMSRNYLRYSPVSFTHGTGIFDILVPSHYTLWICMHSRGPVSVLYVGVNGFPIQYRAVKNMIYICSDDLPPGNCLIQVIASDAAGRVSVMEQYGVARQGFPFPINSPC